LIEKHPFQLLTPHPRFSIHTHHDSHISWLNEIPAQRLIKDGYAWWRVRINPADAAALGILEGDIVELYNDRGSVLCAAMVTERIRKGVLHSYGSSAKYDPLHGDPGATDKGGCVNLLTSSRFLSKYAQGMTNNTCLCSIRKWSEGVTGQGR
jgi:trimethylamine-N-oxide reductase (cytochrome c)